MRWAVGPILCESRTGLELPLRKSFMDGLALISLYVWLLFTPIDRSFGASAEMDKSPTCYKSKGSMRIKAKAQLKGNSQFIIRKIISDITISLLLYFGLVENREKPAKETGQVETIEAMLERESTSDVNRDY